MRSSFIKIRFDGKEVRIPYVEIVGKGSGPHVFISGGMHGDEINGIAAVEEFLNWAKKENLEKCLSGKITVLPLLNPSGFAKMQRRVCEDNRDLNRSFASGRDDSFSFVVANNLTEKILKKCDFGIDVHDAGGRSVLLPHSRVHLQNDDGCTKEMGQLFGTKIVVERKGNKGMMAVEMNRLYKIPVLTVEIGGAQKLYPKFINDCLEGIVNILVAKKMYKGKLRVPKKQFLLHDRFGVKADKACLLDLDVKLGAFVHVGDRLGDLYYPQTGEVLEMKSSMCGRVFSLWQRNQVPEGAVIYSILEEKKCHIERTTLDHFDELKRFDIEQVKM